MSKKFGISISTYSNLNTPKGRFDVIKRCLESIMEKVWNTNNNVYVSIVSDTITKEHLEILENFPFHLIKNKQNMGIAYVKNIGIKSILDAGCDYGFLLDDDIVIKSGEIFLKYIEAIDKTGIGHFSYFIEDKSRCEIKSVNNYDILKTPHVNGILLTFTKKSIEKTGFFEIFPYKYGHEHSKFSVKNIHKKVSGFFCDIIEKESMISTDRAAVFSTVIGTEDFCRDSFHKNSHLIYKDLDKIIDFEIDSKITEL